MKKSWGVVIIIAFVTAMFLVSCKPKEPAADEQVTLRFMAGTPTPATEAMVTKTWAHVEEVTGVKIERMLTAGGWFDYFQKLMAQVAANDVPDLIRMRTGDLPYLSQQGFIADLGPRIAQLSPEDWYLEYFMFFAGKQVAVPSGIYTHNLWYNKDMLAEAGIRIPTGYNDAWTFDEFRDAAKRLTSGSGTDKVYGYSSAFDGGRWATFIWGNGADFYDAAGKPTYNTPRFKEAFQLLTDMMVVDGSMANPAATQAIGPRELFMAGKVAMISGGQWDIASWETLTDFEVGVAPPPYNPNNSGAAPTATVFVDGYCIMQDSKNHDKTWEAILAFLDDYSCDIERGSMYGWPVNKKWAEANSDKLFTPIDRNQMDILMGTGAQTRPYGFMIDEVQQSFIKYFQLMGLGEMSVNDALDIVQQENLTKPVNVIGLNN